VDGEGNMNAPSDVSSADDRKRRASPLRRLWIAFALALFAVTAAPAHGEPGAGLEAGRRGDATTYEQRKALAEEGDPAAQYALGLVYEHGEGRPRNLAEAARWYREAAKQGHVEAQVGLGAFYARGEGVPEDLVRAYALFDLAAEGGFSAAADFRDSVARRMTDAQFAEARRLAGDARRSGPGAIFRLDEIASGQHGAAPARPSGQETPEMVAAAQRALAALGYEPGPADGIAGSSTSAAVRAFQAGSGLAVDGEVSAALLRRLDAALAQADRREPLLHGAGLLWMVEGAAPQPSYLFGTMHSSDPRVLDLPPAVAEALAGAGSVTVEIRLAEGDSVEDFGVKLLRSMLLTDGRTLERVVGHELFARVVAALAPYGLEPAVLQFFKPWVVFFFVSQAQSNLEEAAGGGLALDLWLADEAMRKGKPVYGLETVDEQLAVFDGMAEGDQIALLESAVEYLETAGGPAGGSAFWLEEMKERYLQGDIAAIMRSMEGPAQRMDPAAMRTLYKRLIDDRNEVMVARMASLLARGNAFVAVGAAHLPGEAGILHLLERRGYRVTRIY
jgi:uncharacterized protein YbaP (TraB family)